LHLESDFGTGTHVSVHFPTGRVVRL